MSTANDLLSHSGPVRSQEFLTTTSDVTEGVGYSHKENLNTGCLDATEDASLPDVDAQTEASDDTNVIIHQERDSMKRAACLLKKKVITIHFSCHKGLVGSASAQRIEEELHNAAKIGGSKCSGLMVSPIRIGSVGSSASTSIDSSS